MLCACGLKTGQAQDMLKKSCEHVLLMKKHEIFYVLALNRLKEWAADFWSNSGMEGYVRAPEFKCTSTLLPSENPMN